MLKRSKRIDGRNTVQSIIKEGKRTPGSFFVICRSPGLKDHHRYAVVVGKKLEKSAARRNHKRRQLYELLRLIEQTKGLSSSPVSDIVVLLRQPGLNASFGELQTALIAQLSHS